ncbi:MAG: hypothetical protein JSW61_09690 [Candidatus Thorarchaeota archaeon]|nr:MAG: hypothetical protein JSW61_09690 [Candidatus Thorarchaeota archaeon]
MKAASLLELDGDSIDRIIGLAESLIVSCYSDPWTIKDTPGLLGTLFHNIPPNEVRITRAAAHRLGLDLVDFGLHEEFTMNDEEILHEVSSISSVADALVAGFVDLDTFGKGRELVEKVAGEVNIPFVSVGDDIYSNQSALAELLAVKSQFGKLEGQKITVSWGFGTRFHLPTTAHSLMLLGAAMGAHVTIAAPPKFQLLRRVIKKAGELSKEANAELVEAKNFGEGLESPDVVYAMNWCRLDDFAHPERHAEAAAEFKDWVFTEDNLQSETIFLTEPPAQTDLIASPEVLKRAQNIATSWLARRVAVLSSCIIHSSENKLALF